MKIFATSLTVASGGSGGVFAPVLAIGAFLGAFFWMVLQYFDPNAIPIPAPLVIVGMMALFAGVGRVPIAVILMVSEMTGNLTLLAPSIIAVVISYLLTGSKFTIYRNQVPTKADSPAHRGEYNVPLMIKVFVRDAMTKDVFCLRENDLVQTAGDVMADKGYEAIPILSADGKKLTGIVTMTDIQRVPKEKSQTTELKEIMTKKVITVTLNTSLFELMRKLTINNIGRVPVVDDSSGELVGIVTRSDMFRTYEKAVEAGSTTS